MPDAPSLKTASYKTMAATWLAKQSVPTVLVFSILGYLAWRDHRSLDNVADWRSQEYQRRRDAQGASERQRDEFLKALSEHDTALVKALETLTEAVMEKK